MTVQSKNKVSKRGFLQWCHERPRAILGSSKNVESVKKFICDMFLWFMWVCSVSQRKRIKWEMRKNWEWTLYLGVISIEIEFSQTRHWAQAFSHQEGQVFFSLTETCFKQDYSITSPELYLYFLKGFMYKLRKWSSSNNLTAFQALQFSTHCSHFLKHRFS